MDMTYGAQRLDNQAESEEVAGEQIISSNPDDEDVREDATEKTTEI